MPFIGIIAEESKENCIRRQIIERLNLRESSVLFIKEKSIENIKNIKFETILLDREFKNVEMLKILLKNVKYLVINSDIGCNLNLLDNLEMTVITYGFNSKSTITASSVNDEEVLVCVQRNILDVKKRKIEPQEIKREMQNDASSTMAITAILLIYGKII